jgi:polysaccharide biosynthesis protein PslG
MMQSTRTPLFRALGFAGFFIALAALTTVSAQVNNFGPPAPTSALALSPIPQGFGVNIHFVQPQPGELQMISNAGFCWVRMDMMWSDTERQRGVYDFSDYDRLLDALAKRQMRAMFILGFGNPLYNNGQPPVGLSGRQAFSRWVGAVVHHFRGRGILWEVMNEPNGAWFTSRLSTGQYIDAALAAGQAIQAAAPRELECGPASATIDLPFLEACFKGGVLQYWDAVTVHPYRSTAPETVLPEYAKLRRLIDAYAPRGKYIPIISGEWGYFSRTVDEATQEKFLPRELLVNVLAGVPLSIWYDWHDDGADANSAEQNFGIVRYPLRPGQTPFNPKPSYTAMQKLVKNLAGYSFEKRIDTGRSTDFVLQFRNGRKTKIAAWTSDRGAEVFFSGSKHLLRGDVQYFDGPK